MTKAKQTVAKGIRVLSVPPVMVTALLLLLSRWKPYFFRTRTEIFICIFLLGIVPVLAYPLQKILPRWKKEGREGQRKLAFLFSLAGYSVSFFWSLAAGVGKEMQLICTTYFLSVLLLTVCNKGLHFRASGHACSVTGPLLFLIYFVGWKCVMPCIMVAGLIVWSSLVLKRHTCRELAGGAVTCMIAFTVSLWCVIYR